MVVRHVVKLTANFERNLEAIEAFLAEAEMPQAFNALLEEVSRSVIPSLQRFPGMGRPFLDRPVRSVEAANGTERLIEQTTMLDPNGELREYVMTDYLLLYARIKGTVYLLSVRHHRELSFDFARIWPGNDVPPSR